MSIQKML